MRDHSYHARVVWDGNRGEGTSSYASYGREYRIIVSGKPDLDGSADPMFRGEGQKHNPEDLFVAAISACHMLTYLALCARRGIRVLAYDDDATGTMKVDANGVGRFESVTVHPRVTIAGEKDIEAARDLHHDAHEQCFIASSCSVPIRNEPRISTSV